MRNFITTAKKKIGTIMTRRPAVSFPTKKMSIEDATRLTVQRYGDALRNLADR